LIRYTFSIHFLNLQLSSSKEKIFFVPHGGVAAIFRRKSCGSGSGSVSGSVSGSGSGSVPVPVPDPVPFPFPFPVPQH
jgi:hypothetical protein